jgi:hypothetical protein
MLFIYCEIISFVVLSTAFAGRAHPGGDTAAYAAFILLKALSVLATACEFITRAALSTAFARPAHPDGDTTAASSFVDALSMFATRRRGAIHPPLRHHIIRLVRIQPRRHITVLWKGSSKCRPPRDQHAF